MNFNFTCIGSRIKIDLPGQIWEAQTYDPSGQTFLTRAFHNKASFVADNYFRCYLSYFSPEFVTSAFSIIGLILFLVGLYYIFVKKQWKLLALLLVAPLFPLFEIPQNVAIRAIIIYVALISVMVYGIWSFLKRKKTK